LPCRRDGGASIGKIHSELEAATFAAAVSDIATSIHDDDALKLAKVILAIYDGGIEHSVEHSKKQTYALIRDLWSACLAGGNPADCSRYLQALT